MFELLDQGLLRRAAYIDGEFVSPSSTYEIFDPSDGASLGRVADCGRTETVAAIEAAEAAFAEWRDRTAKERAAVLERWHDLQLEHVDDLARLMTAEMGKPLAEARGEIRYGASFVKWFAEEGKRAAGDVIPTFRRGARVLVVKQPIGVVGAITPWNFPSAMITRKCAPALAAGCTTVVKPAEATPLSALALAELADRAGIPPGVFNVVPCRRERAPEVGRELTTNPKVRKIGFTGSTAVGKELMRQAASTVKRVSLELGGNAPLVIFEDADIEEAVAGTVVCKFRNTGQTCVCANRIFVQERIYEAYAERLAAVVSAMKQGPGAEPGVVLGPMVNAAALEKVSGLVDDAVAKGARVRCGGVGSPPYYPATVLTGVIAEMRIYREEIFGPVASLIPFSNEDEVISMANDTRYGLAAYFYARDIGRVWRVAEALEYGMVAVNEGVLSSEVAPFGGWKESGIGREGSRHGLDEFLELKYVLMGGLGTSG